MLIAECVKEYKIPVFDDDVFDEGVNYDILGMSDTPEGSIDVILVDGYGEKWGFVLNNGDESDEMYVYSNKKKKSYIGTGKLFNDHFIKN